MNDNQSLFFYGLGAKMVSGIGTFIALAGFVVLMFGVILGIAGIVLGIAGIIFGGAIFLWGKSMRFDYQRQSGTILHKGDWA